MKKWEPKKHKFWIDSMYSGEQMNSIKTNSTTKALLFLFHEVIVKGYDILTYRPIPKRSNLS